jgi:hypothetical protein
MQQAGRDENGQEQALPTMAEGTEQTAGSALETQQRRRKAVGCLLQRMVLNDSKYD